MIRQAAVLTYDNQEQFTVHPYGGFNTDPIGLILDVLEMKSMISVSWEAAYQISNRFYSNLWKYADEEARLVPLDQKKILQELCLHVEFQPGEIRMDLSEVDVSDEAIEKYKKIRTLIFENPAQANVRLAGLSREIALEIEGILEAASRKKTT